MAGSKVVFSIEGAAAQEKIGNTGFFEGSYTAILNLIRSKGLTKENILNIGHNGTNYFIFYWKP